MIQNKTAVITIFAVILIIIISFGAFFFLKPGEIESPIKTSSSQISPTGAVEDVKLTKWDDPAEFTIEYPENLKLDPHKEDNENYAHLEFSSPGRSGKLIVWVKDVSTDSLDIWVKENKIVGAIESTLDGVPAKKVLTDSTPKKIITSAINKGYLYQIETELDDDGYWNKTNTLISSSFKFTSFLDKKENIPAASDADEAYGNQEDISSEEEVIE